VFIIILLSLFYSLSLWERVGVRVLGCPFIAGVSLILAFSHREKGQDRRLADNALNARLPRHFADGRNKDRARRWGFRGDFQGGTKGRRNAMRPSPSPLEPPLEVLETFGGAKVSDNRPAKAGS